MIDELKAFAGQTPAVEQETQNEQISTVPTEGEAQQNAQPVTPTPSVEKTAQTPVTTTPEVAFDWTQKLVEATNGQVKTPDELKAILEERANLSVKYNDLEAKFKGMNPLAAKIAEMADNGVSEAQIFEFVELQKVDLTTLDPVDAISRQLKMQYPDLDNDEIEAFIEQKYGDVSDKDSLTVAQKAQLKVDAASAKKFLEDKRVSLSNPESLRIAQEKQMQQQQFETKVQQTFSDLAKTDYGSKVELDFGKDGKFSYQLEPAQRQEVLKAAESFMIQQGIDPNDTAKRDAAIRLFTNMLHGDELIRQAKLDERAATEQRVRQELSGTRTMPDTTSGQKGSSPDALKRVTEMYDKRYGNPV